MNRGPPAIALTENEAKEAGEQADIIGMGEDSGVNNGEAEASDSQSDMTIDTGEELADEGGEANWCCCFLAMLG